MNKKSIVLSLSFIICVNIVAQKGQTKANTRIDNISSQFYWINSPTSYSLNEKHELKITASKGTDIYHYSGGGFDINNAPMLVFEADSNFIFTSQVVVDLNKEYDGGFLILYSDSVHYGKLLVEKNHQNKIILCSCVTDRYSDDNVHVELNESKVYLKIAKSSELYGFYYSLDGKDWNYLRFFRFNNNKQTVKLGFGVQSPYSEKCTSTFSHINYSPKGFKDGMKGE